MGAMKAPQRCGTCELLVRSGTSGLSTWGKCPHRTTWARTYDLACDHHAGPGKRKRIFVRAVMSLQITAGLSGFGMFVYMDARNGTMRSHLVLGAIALALVGFGLFAWKFDLLSEEPKFRLLDDTDPDEDRERQWWLDDK